MSIDALHAKLTAQVEALEKRLASVVEVRIPRKRLQFDNEIHANLVVLEELRAAGVPVRGALSITGVGHGTLEWVGADKTEDVVLRWTPSGVADGSECESA